MKATDTESFVKKAVSIHGNKYDYGKTVYETSRDKVIITCSIHGDFLQKPNNHLTGYGCEKCGKQATAKKQTLKFSDVIVKANIIHSNKYTYNEATFIDSKTPMSIICPTHGHFMQTTGNHCHKTKPQGCPKCGIEKRANEKRHSYDSILNNFRVTHGDKYDYSNVVYSDYHTKVIITCSIHGDFTQTPAHHVGGNGCPSCADYGFDKSKPAILYYLSINNGQAYKIGITNRDVELRFRAIDLDKIETLFKIHLDGALAYSIEQNILTKFANNKYLGVPLLESGNTELFNVNIFQALPHNATLTQIQETLDALETLHS